MINILKKVKKYAIKIRMPLSITLELTHKCNYNCSICFVDHKNAPVELDASSWTNIFENLKSAGVLSVLVTGGEPLLHNECLNVLESLKNNGFLVSLFTNASLIGHETATRLAKLNLGEIGVTLYGVDEKTHDNYTKVRGSFRKVITSVKIMKDLGININLKWNAIHGLTRYTNAFIDIAETLGVEWHANGIINIGRHQRCEGRVSDQELYIFYYTLIERYQSLEENLEEAKRIDLSWQRKIIPGETRMCGAGLVSALIDPSGILYPCVDIQEQVGDLTKQSFSNLWNASPLWEKFLSMTVDRFPRCYKCKYFNVCKNMCPGAFKNECGSYYGFSRENCRNTKFYLYAMNHYLNKKISRENNPIYKYMEDDDEYKDISKS